MQSSFHSIASRLPTFQPTRDIYMPRSHRQGMRLLARLRFPVGSWIALTRRVWGLVK